MLSFEQFKAHLYAQNWVRLFIKGYEEQHRGEELETSLRALYDNDDYSGVVDRLLQWSRTEEGSSYWRLRYSNFQEYVRNCS